ncbi:hypothetical protein [Virgibacillus salexigens]|uniref:Uncharacterized protein n=1 Tax=Virgibacillus kapii TaxID=1638645 RepID=A0ABQ2DXC6_9BACI|nr:hypothetical protein [Virgibacillus kapii]GGJ75229.1 hypothetical protein GCM10007111_40980 [Virgibacillus kapii]
MAALKKVVKKTVLVIFLLILFITFSTLCGIVFLAIFQWFMQTDFYLGLISSVDFWKWALGIPFIVIIFVFCANVG